MMESTVVTIRAVHRIMSDWALRCHDCRHHQGREPDGFAVVDKADVNARSVNLVNAQVSK